MNELTKEKALEIIEELKPIEQEYYKEYLMWKELPFIPEDLNFIEYTAESGNGTQRIYNNGNISCIRTSGAEWVISKNGTEYRMPFEISSKFVAFQIFSALGLNLSHNSAASLLPDKGIEEYLEEEKKKLIQ